jgi:hypothetical protein
MNSAALFILILAFVAVKGQVTHTTWASWYQDVSHPTVQTELFGSLETSPTTFPSPVYDSTWSPLAIGPITGTNTVYQCSNAVSNGIQPVDSTADDDLLVTFAGPGYPLAFFSVLAASRSCKPPAAVQSTYNITVVTNVSTTSYFPPVGVGAVLSFGITGADDIYSVLFESTVPAGPNAAYTTVFNFSAAITGTNIIQDPHFIGIQGESYHVMGEPEKWFNIISTPDFQFNAYFQSPCEGKWGLSYMTKFAFLIDGHELLIPTTGNPTLDGTDVWRNRWGSTPVSNNATFQRPWDNNFHLATKDFGMEIERHVVDFAIQKPGWMFYGTNCVPAYFNLKALKEKNEHIKSVHGLLGQTAHHKHADLKTGNQGEGEIEGTYKDYEVSGPFATNFKFNKYSFKA